MDAIFTRPCPHPPSHQCPEDRRRGRQYLMNAFDHVQRMCLAKQCVLLAL